MGYHYRSSIASRLPPFQTGYKSRFGVTIHSRGKINSTWERILKHVKINMQLDKKALEIMWNTCILYVFVFVVMLVSWFGVLIVRYSREQLFDVVAAVDLYNGFVPWCQRSEILKHHPDGSFDAELEIGFKFLVESYVSHVELNRPKLVKVFNLLFLCCIHNDCYKQLLLSLWVTLIPKLMRPRGIFKLGVDIIYNCCFQFNH